MRGCHGDSTGEIGTPTPADGGSTPPTSTLKQRVFVTREVEIDLEPYRYRFTSEVDSDGKSQLFIWRDGSVIALFEGDEIRAFAEQVALSADFIEGELDANGWRLAPEREDAA